jgi:hypothetical protein
LQIQNYFTNFHKKFLKEEIMLKIKLIICFLASFSFLSAKLAAQDMAPPKPLDNKVYEAMTGNWSGDSQMMGMTMHQEVKTYWAMNHQYIIMELVATAKDNPAIKYTGTGVFGVDASGNAKTWWFDDWGASAMSVGSGTFSDNTLTMTDGNEMFKESRTFTVKGSQLTMSAKGSMKMNGADVPFDETSTFTKK